MNFKVPRWLSLKTKVTLFTLLIFVIGIWSLALYASRVLREDMEAVFGDQQFSAVSVLATGINQALDDRIGALEAVARSVSADQLDNAADLQAFLERLPILQKLFNGGVIAVRADGTAIIEAPRGTGRIGINYMDIDTVAAALKEGKTTIGQPVTGKKLKAPVFGMTAPIRNAQGKVIGALSGVINLGKPNFLDQITQGNYGKTGGYVLVARPYRLIVTASDKSRIMEGLPAHGTDPLIERFLKGYEGSGVLVNPAGVKVLVSAKGVALADWYVGVSLPAEEAFAPILDMQQHILNAALLFTLLAGALTWWMLRRQLTPLLATAKALADMSDTSRPLRPLPITTDDEIGQLIGGFNRLLEALRRQDLALHEKTERLNEAQHIARVGSWTLDSATGEPVWSDEAIRLFEIDPARFGDTYDAFLNTIHPDDRDAVKQAFSNSIDLRVPYEITYRLCMSDGRVKWMYEKCMLTFDAAGKPLRYHGTVQDVTERKQAEVAARLAEHSIVIETSPIPITIARLADGRFVEVNDALVRLLGRKRVEMLGRTSTEIGYWWSADAQLQWSAVLHQERELSGYEVALCDGRGTPRSILMSSSIIEFAGEACIISFLQDITELKQALKALQVSEARFRSIFENVNTGIASTDGNGRISSFNEAFRTMLGYDAEALTLMSFIDFTHPDDLRFEKTLFDEILAGQRDSYRVTKRYIASERRILWVDISVTVIRDAQGKVANFVGVVRDITERKQSEERMEDLSRHLVVIQESARRRLSGELHDRTSPNLAAIGVNLNIMAETMLEAQSPILSDRLEDVRALIEDTTASIREICSDLRPPVLDYAGLTAALESYVKQFQRRTSIAVSIDCAHPAVRLPSGLESVLFRIVQEALTNCAKHSRAKSILVTSKLDGVPVTLSVSDDGIGFDPYSLGKTTYTSGLGMLTMREMAEFSGGRFILESAPGKGTRVTVEILSLEGQT